MLSPGQYYQQVPKTLAENIVFRTNLLSRAANNPALQRGLLSMCEQDCLFWINTFVWQINPEKLEEGPFITWPFQDVAILGGEIEVGIEKVYQDGILACVEDREDLKWSKSREMGATWIVLMVIIWLVIFKPTIFAIVISKDEDAVDDDTIHSLFGKIRYILDHLPDWMCSRTKDKKTLIEIHNGNSINGDANAASSGVGARAAILFADEFGQFDKNGPEIHDMTRDTCKCRVFVYTHKDQTGMAYQLSYDPKFAHVREIITHWSQHPDKRKGLYRYREDENRIEFLDRGYDYDPNFVFVYEAKPAGGPCPALRSPWYDNECKNRSERNIAMNLDIDPRGASDKYFKPYEIITLIARHARPPFWTGKLIYDDKTGTPIRLERCPMDTTEGIIKLWLYPEDEKQLPRMRAGAGVDVAEGVGKTPSCLSVWNALTGEKFAQYENRNIYAQDFAMFCAAFLRTIMDLNGVHPLLIWEIQGSATFAKEIITKARYAPYFVAKPDARFVSKNQALRPGFSVNDSAVLTLMDAYRSGLLKETAINRDAESLDECNQLVYSGNTVIYRPKGVSTSGRAKDMFHGDIVRADALGYKMITELGYDNPNYVAEIESKIPQVNTSGWREYLIERKQDADEELVWA